MKKYQRKITLLAGVSGQKIHTVNKHRNFSLAQMIYASMQNISLLEGRAKQASALNKWSGDNFIDSGTLPLPNNKIKVEKRVAAAIAVRVCLAAGANPPAASQLRSVSARAAGAEGVCENSLPTRGETAAVWCR